MDLKYCLGDLPVGQPLAVVEAENVPSTVPSLARVLLIVPLHHFADQIFAPSKANPLGLRKAGMMTLVLSFAGYHPGRANVRKFFKVLSFNLPPKVVHRAPPENYAFTCTIGMRGPNGSRGMRFILARRSTIHSCYIQAALTLA